VDFSQFFGTEDILQWIYRVERFFRFYKIPKDQNMDFWQLAWKDVTSHIFHIIETLLHKNLYNKLEYKNLYIHHVFQIILLRIRFNKISL